MPDEPYETYVAGELHPDSFPVDFDACGSLGAIVEYRWAIDGTSASSESSCDGFSWSFESEGRYTVSLTVVDALAAESVAVHDVVVEDWLIFGLGDSYGSGEGAPDQPIPLAAVNLANAKQSAVDTATAARDAAEAELQAALSEYQITDARLDAVVAALNRYQDAKADVAASCPFPVVACAEAQAELAAATTALLARLAQAGLEALDIDQPNAILQAVANLRNLAEAALDLAEASLAAAEAALAAAQMELADARAALTAEWQNRSCHRSSRSAQVQAARILEERDPHTSVSFVHLACSGATIWEGVVGPYEGIEPVSPEHPPQIEVVEGLALLDPSQPELGVRRPVDAIVLSIGGNDVNFGPIIELCAATTDCPDAPALDAVALAARAAYCGTAPVWGQVDCIDSLAPPDLDAGLDGNTLFHDGDPSKPYPNGLVELPESYAVVAALLASGGLGDVRVLLTQYPDITRDESETLCGWQAGDPVDVRQRNLLGISPAEMSWAANDVAGPLSDTMEMNAGLLGWEFVAGAAELFRAHGYCSQLGWVVRVQESFLVEGLPYGAVHPNGIGHWAWAELIAAPEPHASAGVAAAICALAFLTRRRAARRSCGARARDARLPTRPARGAGRVGTRRDRARTPRLRYRLGAIRWRPRCTLP
jgi:hypothetical protein